LCGHVKIAFADDVAAPEKRSRILSRHHHGDSLRDAGPDQIPDRYSPEIMANSAGNSGLNASTFPFASRFLDSLIPPVWVNSVPDHSARNVLAGSTRSSRQAGTPHAIT